PYLDALVYDVVQKGKLKAQLQPEKADVFIIAVPTPINHDKSAKMDYVEAATRSIVPYLEKGNMVILESTSPPGTVDQIMMPILASGGLNPLEDLYVAHSPERVIPGKILIELVENNRVVGGINEVSAEKVKKLYETFVKGEIYTTNPATAEMCKLMENTYRDVNIALANEVAMICEIQGINVWDVIKFANKHPRVQLHQPGPGVGGHCIAVDPWFIAEKNPDLAKIITLARNTNDQMPMYVYTKIKKILGSLKGKAITILGMTYKADTDDIRESPIIELVSLLEDVEDITIRIYDPFVKAYKYLENDIELATTNADILVLGVNHMCLRELDYAYIRQQMKTPVILDTRNALEREELESLGYKFLLLGDGFNE
nr:nucleotide sugar dehydrogenase [Vallitaleaceae bacterium]